MQITNVEALRLLVPLEHEWVCASMSMADRTVVIVKVHTSEGIIGLGDAFHAHLPRPEAIPVIVETVLKPLLVGEDPLQIEALLRKMRKGIRYLGNAGLCAIAGVDIALWDILGKKLGAPVYQLLGGGAKAPRMEPYVGSQTLGWRELNELPQLIEEAKSYVDKGYRALKFRGGRGLPERREDVEGFRALRDAFGDKIQIMADVNKGYSPLGMEIMAKEYERYNIFWMEDPIEVSAEDAPERFAALAEKIAVPVAVGGNLFGCEPLRKLIDAGFRDIVKMDASSGGGITEIVKMSHIAAAWGLKWAPVTHEPLGQLATLHAMAAAAPNLVSGMFVEWDPGWPLDELFTNPPRFEDGSIVLSTAPGLGTELKQDFVDKYKVDHF